MKEGVAFEFAGWPFAPKPEGWVEFRLIQSSAARLEMILYGENLLGRSQSVPVAEMTLRELEALDENVLRGSVRNKIFAALDEFKPLDAPDVLRAAQ